MEQAGILPPDLELSYNPITKIQTTSAPATVAAQDESFDEIEEVMGSEHSHVRSDPAGRDLEEDRTHPIPVSCGHAGGSDKRVGG